ncbi:MAG: hypothetical protein ACI9WU_004673, partial [Myxococcota bacterium]
MLFDQLKQAGMKWATSPQAMKLMANPNVQMALMKLLQLPNDVRRGVVSRTGQFAAYADLVTRNDIQSVNRMVRELERELRRVQRKLDDERAKATAAPSPAPAAEAP